MQGATNYRDYKMSNDSKNFQSINYSKRETTMKIQVVCVTSELWEKAADFLDARVSDLERATRLRRDAISVTSDPSGIAMSPCSTQLWARDVGKEHDECTCYFRHWFRKVDGKLEAMRFSHLALMKLVRACVWQALLYEYVTGKLCGRHAVRLRVENELEHYSNCSGEKLIKRIGMLAQDMFNLVKCNLSAIDKPLNSVGLEMAERMVIHMQKLDYRNTRKGWSNRKFRQAIVQRLVDSGLWDIPTRTEQEAYIGTFISTYSDLKANAARNIIRSLSKVYDSETGECLLKAWSKEELAAVKRETMLKKSCEHTEQRVLELQAKIARGERLSGAERKFKSKNKHLFESVTSVPTICNRKQVLQVSVTEVTPPPDPSKGNNEPRKAAKEANKGRKKPKKGNLKPNLSLKDSYDQNTETGNRRKQE